MNILKVIKTKLKLLTTISFIFLIYICIQLFVPSNIGNIQIEIEIPEGTSYRQAINILAKNKLLRDKNLFLILGKVTLVERRIRAGYYSFWGNMSPFQVFKKLIDGRIIEQEITIIEGDSLLEIGNKLQDNNIMSLNEFNDLTTDKSFLKSLNIDAPTIEGYLFPETYKFPKGANPKSIISLMVNTLRKEYTDALMERTKEIGWTENQVLTLASIIEKEAVVDKERPIISAVFHNRLKIGMPLQSDPTAVYGIQSFSVRITKNDWKNKTPFNTYIIKGLPPGPIASAGIESIIAALYPVDIPYLFFVSNRDGTHHFSKTYAEHRAAIRRIQYEIKKSVPESEEG